MATFVLVHGAYHGSWCYARVAAKLEACSHTVIAPTLSGLGEKADLATQAINLSTHIGDVVSAITEAELSDVVLCGHSYAGMVITGVAGQIPERLHSLVYLDAAVPDDGQSAFDIAGPERALRLLQSAALSGTMMEAPDAAVFQVSSLDAAWVNQLLTPQPLATFVEKIRYTGKEVMVSRRTYILCEQYQSINHATFERVRHLSGWKTISLDCGHDLMIDGPDLMADLLIDQLNSQT